MVRTSRNSSYAALTWFEGTGELFEFDASRAFIVPFVNAGKRRAHRRKKSGCLLATKLIDVIPRMCTQCRRGRGQERGMLKNASWTSCSAALNKSFNKFQKILISFNVLHFAESIRHKPKVIVCQLRG